MADTGKATKHRYSRDMHTADPVIVKIAIIGSRKVRRAQILLNFFNGTQKGQQIFTSLLSAQRARLVIKLVDSDGCIPFYEDTISVSEIFIIVQEKNDHKQDPMAFISEMQQQQKGGFPAQVFIVSSPEYNHNLTEVYPVLKGVQYSLREYYQQIRVSAVSSDYSVSLHFLEELCTDMYR